jgi:uncharacterized membrane protein
MSRYTSRKFLLVLTGVLFNLINGILEANGLKSLPPEALDSVNTLIGIFIGVEGVADVVSRSKGGQA